MRSRATSILSAVAVLAALTGCTFTAAQTNQEPYDPSDGFGGEVGDVQVRNALLVTEDGEHANLVVNFINSGEQNVRVQASWETADGRQVSRNIYLSAGATRAYGTPGNRIVLSGLDAELGALFPVYFQYGDEEGLSLTVPVLDGTLEEYSNLLPTSEGEEDADEEADPNTTVEGDEGESPDE